MPPAEPRHPAATISGLSTREARRRLEEAGPNVVAEIRGRSPWRMVADQLTDTMIVVLLVAATLTTLIGDLTDTAVILVVVLANASIGISQEVRAERAMSALARLGAPLARVVRDGGAVSLPSAEVVPGDLLLLEAGDVVAADADLLDAQGLQVDEAALTGESVPVDKHGRATKPARAEEAATAPWQVHAATTVTRGRARAEVTATGMSTSLGRIAGALRDARPPATPLQRRLALLGRQLSALAVGLCAVVLVFGLLRGQPLELMVVTAISLAVAAIPESLPAVVTLALALGAQRMAARNAVIRHLPAVETLGSVTLVATDKTGTLTEGRMRAALAWTPAGETDLREPGGPPAEPAGFAVLARAVVLCNDAREDGGGDPTELALLTLAQRLGVEVEAERTGWPRVAEVAFDASRARMTTLHTRPEGGYVAVCKGSPEAVLGGLLTSSPQVEAAVRRATELADEGYRVLAVAVGDRDSDPRGAAPSQLEQGLTLVGLVALQDPPRARAGESVAACHGAGIRTVMITGDHPATAAAIARRVGILDGGAVVTGSDLRAEADAVTEVDDAAVFARTLPERKLDLVQHWQRAGHVVAMTGDGVNDAPALRAADIGVAMGQGGTDVAKDAADMVLADDDFATIVSAVREGRRIYANIRRFVTYGLAGGAAEILVMLAGPFAGLAVPLLPAQILWINLLTHGLPGVAFGVEPADPETMREPPRPPEESILGGGIWRRILLLAGVITVTTLALGVWAERTDRPWQTVVFVALALLQLTSAFALRAEKEPGWRQGPRSNPLLFGAVLLNVALLLAVVYLPAAQPVFHTEPLALGDLLVIAAASSVSFVVLEAVKLRRRRRAE